ncbi:hypothetical protein D1AOALGA4SA_12273 [Olavius algarvensis Delta 1 endosymbiont]|nr:hypothetical protein D1AOALGA4SA_12273 [Olavius algarvensis Delta 1 endosymbiont]
MQTNSNESKIQYWNIWDIVHAIEWTHKRKNSHYISMIR